VNTSGEQAKPEVLILLSGGIDSAACLDFFLDLGREPCALFVGYGQAAEQQETQAALAIAHHYNVAIDNIRWTGARQKGPGVISGRNASLITAAMMERPSSVSVIALGIHAGTGYADCSTAFVRNMQQVLDLYSEGVQLAAPFLNWTKADVLEYCTMRDVPLHMTYSCEKGFVSPCGDCLSCLDRRALDART